jgi:hypothetical protein
MKYRTSLIVLALLALTFASCSKHSPDATVAGPKVQDLGVVEVSDGVQSRHDLGGGRVCIITPAIQKDGSVLLSMSIEESGKVLAKPRAQTGSGVPFQISVGDIGIGMTPVIKK